MRMVIATVFIGALALVAFATERPADLLLKEECGDTKACVPMLLNYGRLGEHVLVSSKSLSSGYTEFILQVHGRLAGAEPGSYLLALRGYTDGISCCDFGQANGAVLGYSQTGKPILLTSQGPLALTDDSLDVGCSECIKVVDALHGKTTATYPSPSWDLSLTGHRERDFHLSPSGELFLLQGGVCVQLLPNSLFKLADHKLCTGKGSHKLTLSIDQSACS